MNILIQIKTMQAGRSVLVQRVAEEAIRADLINFHLHLLIRSPI